MAKVSIITPVLNGEKYITECIESVLSQSLSDIEYIIVDAGSTDGTLDIIDKFKASDSRIILLNSDKKSYGYQMNLGLKEASGEYIGLVEADDYVDDKMFESLYIKAKEYKLDAIKTNHYVFYGDPGNRVYAFRSIVPDNCKDLYGKNINYKLDTRIFDTATVTWSGIYKRSFLIDNSIWHNESLGASFQDNGFWIQVMISAEKLMFSEDAFYYLRRDNAESSIFSDNKVYCLIHEYEFMKEKILKRGIDTELLLNCFWKKKFDAFRWDITRNKYKYREQLVNKYAFDFKEAIDSSEFFDNGLNTNAYNEVVKLVEDKDRYFDENYRVSRKITDLIKAYKHIYIYGAGTYAAKLYMRLNDIIGSKFSGFIVTRKDNQEYFLHNKVYNLDDLDLNDSKLVLVGVSEKYKLEVQKILEVKGCKYLDYSDVS